MGYFINLSWVRFIPNGKRMILFGTKTRHTKVKDEVILSNSCPKCQGNLELYDVKEWFTLYFIPIFPFNKVDSCYKCDKCKQAYMKEIKSMFVGSQKN
jgi:hypothetical protein